MLGFLDSFNATLDNSEQDLLRSAPDRVTVSLRTLQPTTGPTVSAVRELPEVSAVTPGLMLGTSARHDGKSVDLVTEVLGADAPWQPHVVDGAASGGLVLARKAASDLHVRVGDTITFEHPQATPAGLRTVSSSITVAGLHPNPMRVFAYLDAATSLGTYLTKTGFAGDFAAVDTETLNRYFATYHETHHQGGTVTKQGNLRVFCRWLAEESDSADPYIDPALNRYTRPVEPPPLLDADLISGLLRVTAGRDARSLRDNAIIRLLLTGMRREEITTLRVECIDLRTRVAVTVGLKGNPGRMVGFGRKTAHALSRWLRVRRDHPWAGSEDTGPLWLGKRHQSALTGNGIYQMLHRRAVEAGYPAESVRPHLFRHTRAHEHLADGGSEGDLMRQMGWTDRSMVDRYGASAAQARSIADAHARGLDDRY